MQEQAIGVTFALLLFSLLSWIIKRGQSDLKNSIDSGMHSICSVVKDLSRDIKDVHKEQHRILRRNQAAISALVLQHIKGKDGKYDTRNGEMQIKTILEVEEEGDVS